jgi:hypothetical protein
MSPKPLTGVLDTFLRHTDFSNATIRVAFAFYKHTFVGVANKPQFAIRVLRTFLACALDTNFALFCTFVIRFATGVVGGAAVHHPFFLLLIIIATPPEETRPQEETQRPICPRKLLPPPRNCTFINRIHHYLLMCLTTLLNHSKRSSLETAWAKPSPQYRLAPQNVSSMVE